jgi:hypothetical protein
LATVHGSGGSLSAQKWSDSSHWLIAFLFIEPRALHPRHARI